jgi:hypothetical protein
MTASPEFMLAEKDYAGVDIVVLQSPSLYGALNSSNAEALAKYPCRVVGQVHVKEMESYEDTHSEEARGAANELGLVGGLYHADSRFWGSGYADSAIGSRDSQGSQSCRCTASS